MTKKATTKTKKTVSKPKKTPEQQPRKPVKAAPVALEATLTLTTDEVCFLRDLM